ncbi:tetratricopeptide repeat protein [Enterovibrio sp. Hal110]
MKRRLILLISTLLIVGCANDTSKSEYVRDNGEKLLLSSGNYSSLIARYKKELQKEASDELRYKLANAYYLAGDGEAAMFQLYQISPKGLKTSELALLRANILYDQGRYQKAEQHVNTALRRNPEYGTAYNLKGLILAHRGDLSEAKQAFEMARTYHYDDASVKNNLSMIAILKGDYKEAIEILTPLIQSGRADDTTRANLLLAYAKTGQTRAFSQMLVGSESDINLAEKYKSLHSVELNASTRRKVGMHSLPLSPLNSTVLDTRGSETNKLQAKAVEQYATPASDEAPRNTPPNSVVKTQALAQSKQENFSPVPPSMPGSSAKEKSENALIKIRAQLQKAKLNKEKIALKNIKASEKETKKAQSKRHVTALTYRTTDKGIEYVATSDFDLGKVHTLFLKKKGNGFLTFKAPKISQPSVSASIKQARQR